VKLSKRQIDTAIATERDSYLWDGDLKGFGLKVTPTGKKVFIVQYRVGGRQGRTRRITIGTYGPVTADQARGEARKLLGQVASGSDPAEPNDQRRSDSKIDVLLDRFVDEHILANLKPRTAEEYQRTIKLHIKPKLRHRLVGEILREDIARLHQELRGKPFQANRTVALLSKFFNWCEENGFRPHGSNPCRHISKFKEKNRERFLTAEEFSRLGAALANAKKNNLASPWAIAAIRFLTLSGARLTEALTLKWEFVDVDNGSVNLPDSKTGAKVIYLSPPAFAVLELIERKDGNPFVFCGDRAGRHIVNLQKPWRRIRTTAGLNDVRLHDLRHSFASVAVSAGMSLPLIGALLGHTQVQTTARYAHLADDPLKTASKSIGQQIAASMGDKGGNADNVVNFKLGNS
jgi:integrase